MGRAIVGTLDKTDGAPSFLRKNRNEARREIGAVSLGAKTILWEDLDLLGGVRLESILIESLNQPFTGDLRFGARMLVKNPMFTVAAVATSAG